MKRWIIGICLLLWAVVASAVDLTAQQASTLKAAVLANGTCAPIFAAGDDVGTAACMNAVDATFYLWRTDASVQSIYDQVTWANMTPADSPDGTALYTNRALACQGKQFNLQTILQGRSVLNATINTLRAGLQDALTTLPCGAGGAVVSAGWVGVRDTALKRQARLWEKALANTAGGNGAQATPAVPVLEGVLQPNDVIAIRAAN